MISRLPYLVSAFTLIIFSSCQIGPSNDDDLSFSPGNERQMDNVEATRIEIFCQSVQRYRKVLKSTGINQNVDLSVTANTCSNSDLTTTTVEAVYDMTVEGDLYYQTSDDLCEERIWTERVQPIGQYCNKIAAGKRSDRIQVDLSLYVFAASADANYGTKVILREFSVDPDTKATTFQRAHTLVTQTNVKNSTYGKVMSYVLEERCSDNSNTRYCSQIEK